MCNMSSLNSLKFLPIICLVFLFLPESLCVGESADGNVLCIENERKALLEFKNALVDDYGRLSKWEKQDCCQWNGVQCNNLTGHVEVLDLHGDELLQRPLMGEVSTSLMDLPYLNFLNLSSNDFNGSHIPPILGSLTKLVYLDLSYANFGGKIPNQLGKLSSLKFLDLSRNNLVGEIPNQLGNLSNLQKFYLDHNHFLKFSGAQWIRNLYSLIELDLTNLILHDSNDWSKTIVSLPHLETLVLINCNLSDAVFHLSSLQPNSTYSLKYLDLSFNNFTSSIFPWLFNFSSNLIELYLSNNLIGGPIPYDFGNKLSHLQVFSMAYNQLDGTIPESLGLISEMVYFDVSANSLEGVITEIHFANLTKLKLLNLGLNSLTLDFNNNWVPPFQLEELDVQFCKLGPTFPKWLRTQNQLSFVDISYAGISYSIQQLSFLFCGNGITSNNNLRILLMSDNQLYGQIPNCLGNFKSLVVLDLSNNSLSGNIPISMQSLVEIRILDLHDNILTGELPSLKNCTKLVLLDVGENELRGSIPSWLGDGLQSLEILTLRKNRFHGRLPLPLCHLTSIQVLDLSLNNLSGQIPKCLNNFSALSSKHEINESAIELHITSFSVRPISFLNDLYAFLMWKGKEVDYKDSGRFLNFIDLSSNRLSGEIPIEFGDLAELVSLNLSRNNLSGQIPLELGKLQLLDSLDLSRNHLCGEIPSSFNKISMLSVLDLSNNNLSGEIPTGTQLQGFNASVFSGNPELCGSPLVKPCPQEISKNEGKVGADQWEPFIEGFYESAPLGFITGLCGILGSLLLIHPWRHAYFNFFNNLSEQICIKTISTVLKFSKSASNWTSG